MLFKMHFSRLTNKMGVSLAFIKISQTLLRSSPRKIHSRRIDWKLLSWLTKLCLGSETMQKLNLQAKEASPTATLFMTFCIKIDCCKVWSEKITIFSNEHNVIYTSWIKSESLYDFPWKIRTSLYATKALNWMSYFLRHLCLWNLAEFATKLWYRNILWHIMSEVQNMICRSLRSNYHRGQ